MLAGLHFTCLLGFTGKQGKVHLETVKLLLEHAEDRNTADVDGRTPLHVAARNVLVEIVKLLLKHAKDKNPAKNEDNTPLHFASDNGHVEIVKLIEEFYKDL
jgi:ankyrin repeat protein